MSTHDQSLKALWQNLPSETVTFTAAQMQSRAAKFQVKHKRRDIIEYSSYAVLFGLVAYTHPPQPVWQDWAIAVLVIVGAIIAMSSYYRFTRVKATPSSSSGQTLLEFMRRELRRQRDAAATAWRWYLLPFAPAIVFMFGFGWIEGGASLTEITDMRAQLFLLGGFMVAVTSACAFWMFLRAARYQRQLDDLERYVSK